MTKEEKKEFWLNHASAKTRQYISLSGGAACVTGIMTVLFALAIDPWMWLDAVLTIGLAFGILVQKSRICAVVMLVYFIFSKLLQLGMMTVWSFLTAAVFIGLYIVGVIGTFQYHDQLLLYEKEQAEALTRTETKTPPEKAEAFLDDAKEDDTIYYEENE